MSLDNPEGLPVPQEPKPSVLADGVHPNDPRSQAEVARDVYFRVLFKNPTEPNWLAIYSMIVADYLQRQGPDTAQELLAAFANQMGVSILAEDSDPFNSEPRASAPEVLPTPNEQEGPPA